MTEFLVYLMRRWIIRDMLKRLANVSRDALILKKYVSDAEGCEINDLLDDHLCPARKALRELRDTPRD